MLLAFLQDYNFWTLLLNYLQYTLFYITYNTKKKEKKVMFHYTHTHTYIFFFVSVNFRVFLFLSAALFSKRSRKHVLLVSIEVLYRNTHECWESSKKLWKHLLNGISCSPKLPLVFLLNNWIIDPLHKWHLYLNNNTYTSLASHSWEKNPLSWNMIMRLRMYKVLSFKSRRHLCKGLWARDFYRVLVEFY